MGTEKAKEVCGIMGRHYQRMDKVGHGVDAEEEGTIVLDGEKVRLLRGQKYALCGPNSTSKTALLSAISSRKLADLRRLKIITITNLLEVNNDYDVIDVALTSLPSFPRRVIERMLTSIGFTDEILTTNIMTASPEWNPTKYFIVKLDFIGGLSDFINKNMAQTTLIIRSLDSLLLSKICTSYIHLEAAKIETYHNTTYAEYIAKRAAASYFSEKTSKSLPVELRPFIARYSPTFRQRRRELWDNAKILEGLYASEGGKWGVTIWNIAIRCGHKALLKVLKNVMGGKMLALACWVGKRRWVRAALAAGVDSMSVVEMEEEDGDGVVWSFTGTAYRHAVAAGNFRILRDLLLRNPKLDIDAVKLAVEMEAEHILHYMFQKSDLLSEERKGDKRIWKEWVDTRRADFSVEVVELVELYDGLQALDERPAVLRDAYEDDAESVFGGDGAEGVWDL
ncbi:translational elongation factor EF-1 alpha [Rhizophlyctis rosea]|nr:translational elongation factor EF-1 alpha [Rhizophlyctis rosea]